MKRLFAVMLMMALLCAAAAQAEEAPLTVTYPNGAPGVALAVMAAANPEPFTAVTADTIAAEFAKNEADFIIAPINAGAKLFKAGKSTYRLAAVVTWGNLYFASQKEGFSAQDLSGKLVLFGENTINASVALYALERSGITPAEVEYLAGAANTQTLLLSDPEAVVLTAEPALTAAGIKNEHVQSISVNALLAEAAGIEGYTQAGLFVRAETLNERPEAVEAFLAEAEAACEKCTSDVNAVAEAAVALEILPNVKVAAQAIPGCAIRFVRAIDAKEQVEATAQIDLSQFGGDVPADDFYYGQK